MAEEEEEEDSSSVQRRERRHCRTRWIHSDRRPVQEREEEGVGYRVGIRAATVERRSEEQYSGGTSRREWE